MMSHVLRGFYSVNMHHIRIYPASLKERNIYVSDICEYNSPRRIHATSGRYGGILIVSQYGFLTNHFNYQRFKQQINLCFSLYIQ